MLTGSRAIAKAAACGLLLWGAMAGCGGAGSVAYAQQINLATQVKGLLPAANGGTGTNTGAVTGCPHINMGTWTYSPSYCSGGVVSLNGLTGALTLSGDSTISFTSSGTNVAAHVLGCAGVACPSQSNYNWTTTGDFTLATAALTTDTTLTLVSSAGAAPAGCISFNLPVEVDCYSSITGNVLNGRVAIYGTSAQAHGSGDEMAGIVSSVSVSTSNTPILVLFNDGRVSYGNPQWNAPFQVASAINANGGISATNVYASVNFGVGVFFTTVGGNTTYYPSFSAGPTTAGARLNFYAGGVNTNPIMAYIDPLTGAGVFTLLTKNGNTVCDSTGAGCPALYSLGGTLSGGNVVFGSGAGTGAALTSISGLDGDFYIQFTTGTSPAAGANIFQVNFTASRGHISYCSAGLTGATYTALNQTVQQGSNYSASYVQFASGSTALAASASYTFIVTCP